MSSSGGPLDAMVCKSCGREERASEGYPCDGCGGFVCLICSLRGETKCRDCGGGGGADSTGGRGLGVPGPGPEPVPPSPAGTDP